MKRCSLPRGLAAVATLLLVWLVPGASAATYVVNTAADFGSVVPATLQAGDVVIVKNGTFNAVQRTYTINATAENPVIFRAENPGQAFFSGLTRFTFKGSGLIVSGLVFDGDVVPGGVSGSALFRLDVGSSDMVLRDIVVNNYDTGTAASGAFYVLMNGYRHTIEYCRFSQKQSSDPVINIIPQEDDGEPAGTYPTKDIPRLHRIRYTYFGERTNIGENEYETIRIGESKYQMYNLATVVEHCVFERAIYGPDITNYEPEVISSKSRGNIYRYNTLIDCKGGIVLRHGDDCVVEGNFIFAEPGSNMGAGIRIIGMRHMVRNNYIQDVAGTGLRSPIVVMKGSSEYSENSTDNGYELPSFARIFHNTIVNSTEPLQLGGTTSTSGSNLPRGVEIRGNVIVSRASDGPVLNLNGATLAPFTFENNFVYHAGGLYGETLPATGFTTGTPLLHAHDATLGFTVPQPGSPVIGQAPSTTPPTLRDVRGRVRATPSDAGAFDTQATGPALARPLSRHDVGPSYDGRASTAMAPFIVSTPASRDALQFSSTTFTVFASSAEPLSYQWYCDELPISDATSASYSIASVQLGDAGSYTVAVTNSTGTAFTVPVTLSVTPVVPVITQQPSSQFRAVGGTASFTVAATGETPFTYVWLRNDAVLPGANSATLTLTNLQPSDAGRYVVVVGNNFGEATSEVAELTLAAPNETILVNDTFADGERTTQDLPESLRWHGSTSGSLSVANRTMTIAASGARHALGYFPARDLAIGETLTFSFNFVLGSTPLIFDGGLRLGLFNSETSSVKLDSDTNSNVTYVGYGVFTHLNTTGPNPTLIRKRAATSNQLLTSQSSYATVVNGGPASVFTAGTLYHATLILERTAANELKTTVRYAGGALENYEIQGTDASGPVVRFDTLAVGLGSSNSQPAVTSLLISNVTLLHGASLVPTPPTILTQPAATTASVGGAAQFTVGVNGSQPFTFEWFRGETPIANSNSATLTLTNVQVDDAGDYHVVVTNSEGSATSQSATLTVTAAPTPVAIEMHPVSLTRNVGESATFSVAVSGTEPFTYQWRRNGSDIAGANAASYTIASVLPGDAGSYTVYVTNAGGTATSNAATLSVNVPSGGVQIVAETFADGNRTGQQPPESLAWFVSAATSNATVANGAVTVTANNSSRHFVAYFPSQALAVGDALALDFDFRGTLPANVANGFRVALLNSYVTDPRSLITSDNSSPSTLTYTGYGAFMNPAPAAGTNPLTMRKRAAGAAAGTVITGGNYTQVGSTGGAAGEGFAASTDYHGKFSIERLEESRVRLTIAFTGGTLAGQTHTYEDTAAVLTSFDVIAFGIATGGSPTASAFGTLTLDNIIVTYTPAPPPVETGYNSWINNYFSSVELADAAVSGPLADPDADGFANLLEYALGLDPRESDPGAVPHATVEEDLWTFRYTRPVARADITYVVEASTNLQLWSTEGVVHEEIAVVGETATWQARYPRAGNPHLFFRLRIVRSGPE